MILQPRLTLSESGHRLKLPLLETIDFPLTSERTIRFFLQEPAPYRPAVGSCTAANRVHHNKVGFDLNTLFAIDEIDCVVSLN